ncbi:MAG: response regulator transcription factor [Pseudomonadota bacterium]
MNILAIDDHVLFRSGLRLLLTDLDSEITFHEASDVADAVRSCADTNIDLILLDFYIPGTDHENNIATVRKNFSDSRLVIVSSEERPDKIIRTLDLGVAGFIPKSSTPDLLIAALKLILAGGVYLPPQILVHTDSNSQEPTKVDILENLSARQREVLFLAMDGNVNKIIARKLDLSVGTVKAHLSAAYRVLGVENRTQALCVASQLELQKQ